MLNQITPYVYLVCIRDTDESQTNAEAWSDGDFEPYYYYNTMHDAKQIKSRLESDFRVLGKKYNKVFIKKVLRKWAERL